MTAKKQDKDAGEERREPPFEKSLERLEKIVAEMEGGKLGLEDMISRFEEGQGLVRLCTRRLNEVERRIELLVKQGEDTVAVPFESGESGGEEPDEKGKLADGERL
jgi:exodeoxyribonuclease VII small subunit